MTLYDHSGLRSEPISIASSGNVHRVAASTRLLSPNLAFDEQAGAAGNRFLFNGTLQSNWCLRSSGEATRVDIGATGLLAGETGVSLTGTQAEVVNSGTIRVSGFAAIAYGADSLLRNDGSIHAYAGLIVAGDHSTAINGVRGEILTSDDGLRSEAASGLTVRMVNHGRIVSAGDAAHGSHSDDHLRNDGTMIGDINLGDGNDVIDLRGGRLNGTIEGGDGSDRLVTDRSGHALIEQPDNGYDVVMASASYTLGDNVETLVLTASANVNGAGNILDNDLYGNSGNNVLRGRGGDDRIIGGSGDDRLFGGDGVDTFLFATHPGRDTIEDFQHTQDVISIGDWRPNISFDDIVAHTKDVDGDAVLRFGPDSIRIEGVTTAQLTPEDFGF